MSNADMLKGIVLDEPQNKKQTAIIIGAGPAGLTAAYELLKRTNITPIILEKSGDIGGISKTINYKGNRIDIGGHRFFSKSDRVMNWWFNIMPVQKEGQSTINISYQNNSRNLDTGSYGNGAEDDPDKIMLVRRRLSRIYFLRKFFTYPVQLSIDTLRKLGVVRTLSILFSYLKAQLLPRKPEKSLEDFMINRFGRTLYKLFFKDYTEKVWGVSCEKIPAEWGAQRIKGVSIRKAIQHAVQMAVKKNRVGKDIGQKDTETSLIEQFLYPKYGPGQLWEEVSRQVESMGGKILMHHDVKRIYTSDNVNQVTAVATVNNITGETSYLEGDYFFSTMPVQELIGGLDGPIPEDVREVAAGLQYRDFITVGILLKKLSFKDKKTGEWKPLELKDTWIYIQEKDVKVGRLQLFNNWSPYLVKDPDTVWVGMEYFCNQTEALWKQPDEDIKQLAIRELEKIGLATACNVLDATVLRMEKTYPAYFGTYEQFNVVRNYVDGLENLFLVGRNGMHKYNNSDHSMLTAMVAVDNIRAGITTKENIWSINTEQEYHEEKANQEQPTYETTVQEEPTFFDFVFKHKRHKFALLISALLLLAQFIIYKKWFPFVNFIPDSYAYLEGAYSNMEINMWPIGYSKFLRVFSAFFKTDYALAFFQYALIQSSILYFIFTLLYFIRPGKPVFYLLVGFFVLNPLLFLISNYILADTLFTSLSVVWITQLIWLMLKPSKYHIWLQAILLMMLFTIRFNALYYPIITIVVLLLCKLPLRTKFTAVGLSVLLVGIFLWHNSNQYKELTGTRQFSGFGGWQLAANATIMYAKMDTTLKLDVPPKFREFHAIVNRHRDSLNRLKVRPDSVPSIYYLWDDHTPVKRYLALRYKNDTATSYFKRWATLSPFYAEYGKYLITHYPKEFARYYLADNIKDFCVPPLEFLSIYNMGFDSVGVLAKEFFGYKSQKVNAAFTDFKVAHSFPVIFSVTNVLFMIGSIGFVLFNGLKHGGVVIKSILAILILVWFGNFGFSVLASPIVLRYQILTLILFYPMGVILFDYILKSDSQTVNKTKP
jgi:Protoporphyrinogen oxidase